MLCSQSLGICHVWYKLSFNLCVRPLLMKRLVHFSLLFCLIGFLAGCAKPQPDNVNDICSIFKQYPKWYWATKDVETRWRVPITVQMAIMHQESRFSAIAKPPRTKLLWIIPWKRPSTAYGYTQALDQTWAHYKKDAGKYLVDRDNFADGADFVGWYGYQAYKKAGIKRDDAYRLYLAYHEGIGGYQRRTYLKKPWLIKVARKVKRQQVRYATQLNRCQKSLEKKPWWRIW